MSKSETSVAPILWQIGSEKDQIRSTHVDDQGIWFAQHDAVYALDHSRKPLRRYSLGAKVTCLMRDDRWLFAACDDGRIYELRDVEPRLLYDVETEYDIGWFDIFQGRIAVADGGGQLTVLDQDGRTLFSKQAKSDGGWMVRCDKSGVYHGPEGSITKYDWSGKKLWRTKAKGYVQFGCQTKTTVCAGTSDGLMILDKKTGKLRAFCEIETSLSSCGASEDGRLYFASCDGELCVYGPSGKLKWTLGLEGYGGWASQVWDGRYYLAADTLVCIDLDKEAIAKALKGDVKPVKALPVPKRIKTLKVGSSLKTATAGDGVVLECVAEGEVLRVRPVSGGYRKGYNVQFPNTHREEGAKYVVESLVEVKSGGFYRVEGEIWRLKGSG